jgi:hypothetical protein
MRRTTQSLKAVLAEMDAQDRAIRYLDQLPHQVAAITALRTALELFSVWEAEKHDMIRRRDPRPVYLGTREDLSWLYSTAAKYSQDPLWESCSDEHLTRLFAGLPSDAASFEACVVARWAYRRAASP